MSKATELLRTNEIVLEMLRRHKSARNSDNVLYIKVCERINPAVINRPFWDVLSNVRGYGFPQFETVRRTRQKIQAEHPELAASSDVEAARMANEETVKEYAVSR